MIATVMRLPLFACLLGLLLGPPTRAVTWLEDFTTDPALRGWRTHGDISLHAWNPDLKRLDVTWDSTRTNTFFYRPLRTVLAREDRFRLGFELGVEEFQPSAAAGTFQLAVGLIRMRDAFRTNSFRGAGINPAYGPRNLFEFDYFPANRSITPTFSAVIVGTNNLRWAMANVFPLELTTGDRFRVELTHDPAEGSVAIAVWRNGEPYGNGTTTLTSGFGDFRFDTVSITSYSGDHQPANYGGQILARGWVDGVELEYPANPVPEPRLERSPGGEPTLACDERQGWVPDLEESTDLRDWAVSPVPPVLASAAWRWSLDPGGTTRSGRYFRLAWDRP